MIAIVLALICAFSYGVADFWGGLATRRGSIWKVLPIIVAAGILTLSLAVPFLGATFSQGAVLAGIGAGLSGIRHERLRQAAGAVAGEHAAHAAAGVMRDV
jgi:hypothetical protein